MLNRLFLILRLGYRKKEELIKVAGLCVLLFGFTLLFCSAEGELSGSFEYISGRCESRRIDIKKVRGFGNRYYLIKIFRKDDSRRVKEFLGVVNGKKLTIYKGTNLYGDDLKIAGIINYNSDTISVHSDGKRCIYGRR